MLGTMDVRQNAEELGVKATNKHKGLPELGRIFVACRS